jgi:hypothetical protein
MHHRCLTVAATLGVLFPPGRSLVAQTPAAPKGQTTTAVKTALRPPRTADGHPDLRGIWSFANTTPLERPEQFAGRDTLSPEEAANFERESAAAGGFNSGPRGTGYDTRVWFERGEVTGRTALIVDPPDGKMPPMTAEGQSRAAVRAEGNRIRGSMEGGAGADGPEDRTIGERCILGFNSGPPMRPNAYNQNVDVFQTRDYVALLNEMNHMARVIPLDGRPRVAFRQWVGESRGHWDGDTLVIETTNYRGDAAEFSGFGATENLRLVERFTRVGDTLLYEFTVNDPATWTRPWTVQLPMTKGPQMYEYACHEGNYAMEHILSAARASERAAESGTGK